MTWTLTPEAREDLFGIWQYSEERWGEAQADLYVSSIEEAIGHVADAQTTTVSRSRVRAGYVETRAGSHLIFMKPDGGDWLVVRVLHERMDVDRHLPR